MLVYLLATRDIAGWALDATDCLTPEETERARRLEDSRRRELFLVSRVALRHVLARRLDCAPAEVPLIHDPSGGAPLPVGAPGVTPSEVGADGAHGAETASRAFPAAVTFYSLARTPGVMTIALARRPVGVDVEALQSPAQSAALLEILHPAERTRLLRVPQRRRPRAVTDAWVRLEAVLKARGVGLTLDPAQAPVGRRGRLPGEWRVTGVRAGRRTDVRLAVAWRGNRS